MKNQISEKQIDQIAKSLLQSFPLDEAAIEEIASSPKLLWNLNSRIATENSKRKTRWFFGVRWRIAAFATLIVICGVISARLFVGSNRDVLLVVNETPVTIDTAPSKPISDIPSIDEKSAKPTAVKSDQNLTVEKRVSTSRIQLTDSALKISRQNQIVNVKSKSPKISSKTKNKPENEAFETKTEFIALSYSPVSESGQIVRVKVPRSMMVSLGFSNNVSKNSELVNAEVIIDDDGSTRAIRFISEK